MFVGLGDAERRLLLIIRPGVPLTVTDAKRIYPETDHRTHRRAMVSLARKGFVQVQPGPVFAIGAACERTTRRGGDAVAASRSELSEGVGMMRARLVSAPAPRPSPRPAPRPVSAPSGDGALGSVEVRRASSSRPAVKEAPRPRSAPCQAAPPRKPPQAVPQAPQAAVFNYASPADEYAARIAREVERQKEAALKMQRTVI
jgi:hypothetical protein